MEYLIWAQSFCSDLDLKTHGFNGKLCRHSTRNDCVLCECECDYFFVVVNCFIVMFTPMSNPVYTHTDMSNPIYIHTDMSNPIYIYTHTDMSNPIYIHTLI